MAVAVSLSRTLRCMHLSARRCVHTPSASHIFDLKSNLLEFDEQTVMAGTESLDDLSKHLQSLNKSNPLIVSDNGIKATGSLDVVFDKLSQASMTPSVFTDSQPNPSWEDVRNITAAYVKADADCVVAVGGGGPIDAAKAAVAVLAEMQTNSSFDHTTDCADFIANSQQKFWVDGVDEDFEAAVPLLCALPTTAGTGSDGGKSAVISNADGVKVVFGHPCLFPRFAALAPQLTAKKPDWLTRSTGVDALSHSFEAYMVPNNTMRIRDGMTNEEIERCEEFALVGMQMVLENLDKAIDEPSDLQARLNMQIASLYGAKAFRKGDLGSIHATAHALGSRYHIHHGTAIGHMFFPVLIYCEAHPALPEEGREKYGVLRDLFQATKPRMEFPSVSFAVGSYLSTLGVKHGTRTLSDKLDDMVAVDERVGECKALAELAAADGCQTNPVAMSQQDYEQVFQLASDISYSVL